MQSGAIGETGKTFIFLRTWFSLGAHSAWRRPAFIAPSQRPPRRFLRCV